MSIADITLAFQARHRAIGVITSAPDAYPNNINSADLPLVLTDALKGKTDWESHGGDLALEVRAYRVRCFCLPTGQGTGIDQGKQQAIGVLDGVLASYRTAPTLTSTAAIRIEAGIEDTGPKADMQYTDTETRYWGFELVVQVEERWE